MDVSDIVNYGTLGLWVASFIMWIARLARGKEPMPRWLKVLSSNVILGVVIVLGLAGSIGSTYLNYMRDHQTILEDVTISAYPDQTTQTTLQIVSGKTLEDQTVPLDGHVYDHCTFQNVCLLYDGGPYQLQHVTFKDKWKVCSNTSALKNYTSLVFALHLNNPYTKQTEKSVLQH